MAAWADSSERFVEIPGIVEIRWVSDDPDYYVAPIDLFDEQRNGLPDFYGKKDKTTTEQAFFTCNVCECDLKSVVTLRAHCKGTQHIRKALQKKKEWRVMLKKEAREVKTEERFKTLFEWLDQGTSEAVVGLEHVTEYLSGDNRDIPYYHCDLEHCKDEQGEAEVMKNHVLTARHKQAWLEIKTGSFLKHQTEISQRIAEFTKDFKRDFRDMKVVEDRDMWNKAREGRIRGERAGELKAKREKVEKESSPGGREDQRGRDYEERGHRWRERSYGEERTFGRDRDNGRGESRKREDSFGREDESRGEKREYTEREPKYKREESFRKREQEYREKEEFRERDRKQEYREREDMDRKREVYRERTSPKRERVRESSREVEEVTRSGNFDNWSTAMVKADTSMASTSSQAVSTTNQQRSVSEELDRLHRKVATKVMKILNKFYPGAEEFEPEMHKIGSPDEYSRLAKQFSHKLRKQIKESYEAYNGTLEGIILTGDHEQFIRTEVESYFEGVARVRK